MGPHRPRGTDRDSRPARSAGDAATSGPLPHGDQREHVVHQVRGAVRHAAPATARTKAATLARERQRGDRGRTPYTADGQATAQFLPTVPAPTRHWLADQRVGLVGDFFSRGSAASTIKSEFQVALLLGIPLNPLPSDEDD